MHARGIEFFPAPAQELTVDGRLDRTDQQAVTVAARAGAVAGVEIIWHRLQPERADAVGKPGVGAEHPGAGIARGIGVEMHELAAGRHAGIGAPGADHFDRGIGHERHGLFDRSLNRVTGIVFLPAHERAAVVLQGHRVTHVSSCRGRGALTWYGSANRNPSCRPVWPRSYGGFHGSRRHR